MFVVIVNVVIRSFPGISPPPLKSHTQTHTFPFPFPFLEFPISYVTFHNPLTAHPTQTPPFLCTDLHTNTHRAQCSWRNKALKICVFICKSMALNSTEKQSQDSLKVVELANEGTTGSQCESQLDLANLSNHLNFVKTSMSMDAQSNGWNHANLKNDGRDAYGSYILDIDIERGKFEAPKSSEKMGGNMKTDDCITGMLQREITSLMGGKYAQLLMNHSFELPKFASKDKCLTERVNDTSSNRLRKYKRSTSFNSRRVVLLFSFLSSMGTIILIYLTLRVRMSVDGAGNV